MSYGGYNTVEENMKAQGYVYYWIRYQLPIMRLNSFTNIVSNDVRTVKEMSIAHKPTDTIGEFRKWIVTHVEGYQHLSPSQLRIMDDSKEQEFPDHMTVVDAYKLSGRNKIFGINYLYAIPR